MTAAGIARSLWSCLCTSVPLAVDGSGHGAAGKPGAAALAASAARAALAVAEPYACPIRLAPRSLRGEVPGDRTGPACRTARRGPLGPGRRGLLPPLACWSWIPGPLHATRARSRQMMCAAGPQPLVLVSRHRVRKGRRTLAAPRLRRQAPPLPACTAARLTEPLRSASTGRRVAEGGPQPGLSGDRRSPVLAAGSVRTAAVRAGSAGRSSYIFTPFCMPLTMAGDLQFNLAGCRARRQVAGTVSRKRADFSAGRVRQQVIASVPLSCHQLTGRAHGLFRLVTGSVTGGGRCP